MALGLWAGCGEDGPAEPSAPEAPRPTTVQVSPATTELPALGDTVRLAATVLDQNGQTMAGATVSWTSGDASVATVDGSGLVTGAGNGEAAITAVSGEATGSAAVTVAQRVAQARVSPDSVTLVALGDTVRLAAEALDANGHAVADAEFAWSSGDTLVAVVDGSGLVTSAEIGAVEITATSSGVSGRAALIVAAPAPTTVAVIPDTVALTALGATAQLAVEVSDQLGRVMTSVPLSWSSADTTVAAVDSAGLVTAAGSGATAITARAGDVSGMARVTVRQRVAQARVSPDSVTLVALGDTVRLSAEALDANGHAVADAEFAWSSGDTLVAVVDGSGLVTSAEIGAVEITATSSSVSGRAALTVAAPAPTTVAVIPDTVALTALGATAQLAVEVSDQLGRVMTSVPLSWSSADTTVAAVDSAGLVTAAGSGATAITARAGDVSGMARVTVRQSAGSVVVSPAADTVALGDTVRLSAEALDANGHWVEGAELLWSSSNVSVAGVDGSGLVMGKGEGSATITATAGDAQGASAITVENPDRAALVALYEATDGPNWRDNTNWLTDAPLGEWYGVTTDRSGRVFSLQLKGEWTERGDISKGGLSGLIPPELGNLANLSALSLFANDLTGPIPPELGNLANLRTLDLSQNRLTGEIPPELGNLANLNWLLLGDNSLTGGGILPELVSRLANLTFLDLSGSRLTGEIPPELGNLANLRTLYLRDNHLTGEIPPELGNLANLRTLELSRNELTGEIPPELGKLGNLHGLVLARNQLTGEIPSELGDLSKLANLDLARNRLTGEIPSELANLSNMFQLALTANRLTGGIPPELGRLSELRYIFLGENRLTGGIPPELGNLSKLSSPSGYGGTLWLADNQLTGRIPPELGRLSQLDRLILANNHLTGPVPQELGNLRRMWALVLQGNPALSGPLPRTFIDLNNLRQLFFVDTGLCAPTDPVFQDWLMGLGYWQGSTCEEIASDHREVLNALYDAAGGPNWTSSTNWGSDSPLNDWYGVTADAEDQILELDLSGNGLAGALTPHIGNVLTLERLRLGDNPGLMGDLPRSLTILPALRELAVEMTGLCIPPSPVFLDWLDGVEQVRGERCRDDHGHTPETATEAPLGEMVSGELDYVTDEDLFYVQVPRAGTLTARTSGDTETFLALLDDDNAPWGSGSGPAGLVRRVTPGRYFIGVSGVHFDTKGTYSLEASFEALAPPARAYLTQAVQSHDAAVPLVAGEDALLRVFVTAPEGVSATMPPVRATFHRGGTVQRVVDIPASAARIPTEMREDDLGLTANMVVEGSMLMPGLEMVVEIDPDGTLDPSLGIGRRIPDQGRLALDIHSMPRFEVTAVPILHAQNPDSSGFKATVGLTADHEVFYETRDWLPVRGMEVTVREPLLVDYDPREDMGRALDDIELLRVADGAPGYYMGVPPWQERGVLGIAFLEGRSSVSRFEGHTVAHEFGHNFSLNHAPCGRPAGVDPHYPHRDGLIGGWGYDFRQGALVDPEWFTDLMTYCRSNDWISDYSFTNAAEYRTTEAHATMASLASGQVLVVRGGVAEGRLRIEPAFVLDAPPTLPERNGAYRLVGSGADGGELFTLDFAMQEIIDTDDESAGGFTFGIPVRPEWTEALATITLAGPGGSVTLTGDDPASPATALVVDAATGRIRAILRESALAAVAADGTDRLPSRSITMISRGIPDPVAWRR